MVVWPFKIIQKQIIYPPSDVCFYTTRQILPPTKTWRVLPSWCGGTIFNKQKQAPKTMCSISFLREKHQQKQAKEEAALVTGGNVRQLDCIPVNTCD